MGSEVALNFEIKEQSEDLSQKKNQVFLHLFFITIGLAALIAGGNLSLEGATSIARLLGVSERVIGLTIIAIGTSLPELVTSLIAVYRKYEEIALSNILGSNIFNSLGVIGAASLFGDLHVSTKIVSYDYFYMLGVLVLLFPFMFFLKKIPRLGGAFFILVWLYYNFSLI